MLIRFNLRCRAWLCRGATGRESRRTLACDLIGVNDGDAPFPQHAGDGALARRDPARESVRLHGDVFDGLREKNSLMADGQCLAMRTTSAHTSTGKGATTEPDAPPKVLSPLLQSLLGCSICLLVKSLSAGRTYVSSPPFPLLREERRTVVPIWVAPTQPKAHWGRNRPSTWQRPPPTIMGLRIAIPSPTGQSTHGLR